jgi:hypothetical protein
MRDVKVQQVLCPLSLTQSAKMRMTSLLVQARFYGRGETGLVLEDITKGNHEEYSQVYFVY